MKKFLFPFAILLLFVLQAQRPAGNLNNATVSPANNGETWKVSVLPQSHFIENLSQFDGRNGQPDAAILYAVDEGPVKFFFTKSGYSVRMDNKQLNPKFDSWKFQKKMEGTYYAEKHTNKRMQKFDIVTEIIHAEWVGANSAAEVIATQLLQPYHNYRLEIDGAMKMISNARSFEKITYKNLYPKIDVEYITHPDGGIKYNIIAHPGADLSKVKMRYAKNNQNSNESEKDFLQLDEKGNLQIKTAFGNITDHAPVAFYDGKEKKKIAVSYQITGDEVSFVTEKYSVKKTFIIDPWVITPAMPSANKVYYIKRDANSNVYLYGGDAPYRLQKLDAGGNLLWTYTPGWTASNNWFGALAVDPDGNSFITSGSSALISKINTSGVLVWSNTGGFSDEYWTLDFNCDYTQLFVGGTRVQSFSLPLAGYGAAFSINMNTGAIMNTLQVASQTSDAQIPLPVFNEIRSMCAAPDGNYYFMTLDTIGSFDGSLSLNYRRGSDYLFSYYLPYGQGGTGQGTNGIRATPYFLYTTNGQVLHQRDINAGNIINTVFIPGGVAELCSGIDVDSCGNVYVGSIGQVIKYDMNLNLVTSAPTTGAVYDVTVTANGEVLASGNNFALSTNLSACPPVQPVCVVVFPVDIEQTNVSCFGGCNGSAKANPTGGTAPFTYLWNNGQTTASVTNLCAGTYIVTVTDANSTIAIGSVVITEPPVFSVSLTQAITDCGTAIIATPISGATPYTYVWSNGATAPSVSGLASGTYSVTVTDNNNCSVTNSLSVTQSPGLIASDSVVNPACGACDGIAIAIGLDGNPPYNFLWSTGDTVQTISGLCAGIYNVTISEQQSTTPAVFWSEDFSGNTSGWTLNVNGSGPNGSDANIWVLNNNRNSDCPACPSNGSGDEYLHVACNPASFFCIATGPTCAYGQGAPFLIDNTTDKYAYSPLISTIGKTNITLSFWFISAGDPGFDYGLVTLSFDGGATWNDLPAEYSGVNFCSQANIALSPDYENIPNFRFGFRWISNNDLNGNDPPFLIDDIELNAIENPCSVIATVILSSEDGPDVAIDSITDVRCRNSQDGMISLSVSGGTSPFAFEWSNGDSVQNVTGLSGGSYLVTVTDSAECVQILSATVAEPSEISITGNVTNAGCTSGGAITITAAGGTPPFTYGWSTGAITQNISNVQAGAYEVTVTDFNSCEKTALFNVSSPAFFLTLQATDASCGNENNGTITSNIIGGSAPYQYQWSNGATTSNLTNIGGGNYSLTVTDNSGCNAVQFATVGQPDSMTFVISPTYLLCDYESNGAIKLNPIGGIPPYEALWSNADTGLSITNLPPGEYYVTVTDAAGCESDTFVLLTAFSIYELEIEVTAVTCEGVEDGAIEVSILSGTTPPYTFLWNTNDTTTSLANLSSGSYDITVSDNLGCMRTAEIPVAAEGLRVISTVKPVTCPGIPNGAITLEVTGGRMPYSFLWSNAATTPALVSISDGNYSVTVSDPDGCSGTDNMVVTVDTTAGIDCDELTIYDVFSPNGDGVNDLWVIDGLHNYPANEVQIFNRWGGLVYEARPYDNTWDGRSKKGEHLPVATYYYIFKLNDAEGTIKSGHVNLVR